MKRAVILLICTLLSAGLIACGDNENVVETPVETVEFTETVSVTEEVEPTEAVVEEKTEVVPEVVEEVEEENTITTEESQDAEEDKEDTNVEIEVENTQQVYTYKDMAETKYAKSTVNVRDLPDKNGNKLGSFSQNDEVQVTGQCNETGWYRIDYNGSVAYVSNSLLVNEKVEVSVAQPVENNQPAATGGSGVYSNIWGQTWTMTYNDVAAAFGQPVCTAIADSDSTGHFYYIKCHIRDCDYSGPNWLEAIAMVNSQGWSVPSVNEANKVAKYDGGLWDVVYVECYR